MMCFSTFVRNMHTNTHYLVPAADSAVLQLGLGPVLCPPLGEAAV